MRFNKLVIIALLAFSLSNSLIYASNQIDDSKEILQLKQDMIKMQSIDIESAQLNEKFYKHKIALSQAKIVKKIATYETYEFLTRNGCKRNIKDIGKMVDVAWACSWIFKNIGSNQPDRFIRILEWCKSETNFRATTISKWKKGQYIRSLNKYVLKDSEDYGAWQINSDNFVYAQDCYNLYRSGVIPFKIVRVRCMTDLFDIPTNCVVRCAIETDRKSLGMEWMHHKSIDRPYVNYLSRKIKGLENEGLYDPILVERYYHLIPIKTYGN